MAQARVYRSGALSTSRRGRRKGTIRLTLLLLFVAGVLGVRGYVQFVYGPGLRAEARTVPGLVHAELAQQGAPYVPLQDIAPDMQNAIVAIEDHRFYQHHGIDPQGILRALIVNLERQHVDQGGSTLEEQLAKRAIVQDDSTLRAKLRTLAIAWALDEEFTKRQILELYLNAAYYGQGAYGIASAARTYFAVNPDQLTLPEAAFLAALPQAPSIYGADPTGPAIMQRKDTVLDDLYAQGYISANASQQAKQTRLVFALPAP